MKTIYLTFDGVWSEGDESHIPSASDVYCVYACTFKSSANAVYIRKLLYVGESCNVRERLKNHERIRDWKRQLKSGEMLCYSFAEVGSNDRKRAEAAVIFRHQPPCKTEYKNRFPYENTAIKTSGRNLRLNAAFTVFSGC